MKRIYGSLLMENDGHENWSNKDLLIILTLAKKDPIYDKNFIQLYVASFGAFRGILTSITRKFIPILPQTLLN